MNYRRVLAFRVPILVAAAIMGVAAAAWCRADGGAPADWMPLRRPAPPPMMGPLRMHPTNPRYFTDDSGAAILLAGAHTWSTLQDNGGGDPPPAFDYDAYLDFLEAQGHNFFRLWTWEQCRWTVETTDADYWFTPCWAFLRTGPGMAEDGKPRYDLTRFDQAYFDRLRQRVIEAGERGLYVAIVFFNGWSVEGDKGGFSAQNPWRGHPFKAANNVNGIDGDPDGDNSGEETHELTVAAVTAIQEAYVRKVIDTVGDLDNVLYEISNESHQDSEAWQYHLIDYIKQVEASRPKQHPVGMTVEWPNGDNEELFAGPADWVSPNGDVNNPPAADGTKVIIYDTDHLCGICGDRKFAWKAFVQGGHPIFMDGYDGAGYGVGGDGFDFDDPRWMSLRANLGYVRSYAERLDLARMEPQGTLASTGYCLASATAQQAAYLVYLPDGGDVTVDLSAASGMLAVEWMNPSTGEATAGASVPGGAEQHFIAPFGGDAVLFIQQTEATGTAREDVVLPMSFSLAQNYPNPFNPVTTIQYALPQQATVRLEVYDTQGQRVAVLVNGPQLAGVHDVPFDASRLASGHYLYRLCAGGVTDEKTMTLAR